jgi:2-methylcitrate dehydratase PrpD
VISDAGTAAATRADPTALMAVADVVGELTHVVVDDRDREVARARLADTVFATAVGCRTEQGERGAAVSAALYGEDSLASRAFRLSAACRMTEIDDVDLLSCTTPGAMVVPTVLAVLASPEVGARPDLKGVLDAVVVGYEVAIGLGESMVGPTRLATGVWPSLAAGCVTAAVVATLLIGGDREDLEQAAVLAAQQSIHGNPRGSAREHMFAGSVVIGIGSALAVRRGFTTPAASGGGALGRLLTDPVAITPDRRIHRPVVKEFCSARQAMTAVAALREALAGRDLAPAAVERIDVDVPHQYAAMLDKPRVSSRRESVSSVQYQLALAISRPDGLLDVGRADLGAEELAPLMATVRVHGNDELSQRYPQRWPARVRITAGGSTVEVTADVVPGEDDHTLPALVRKTARFPTDLSALGAEIAARVVDAGDAEGLVALARLVVVGDDMHGRQLSPPAGPRSDRGVTA